MMSLRRLALATARVPDIGPTATRVTDAVDAEVGKFDTLTDPDTACTDGKFPTFTFPVTGYVGGQFVTLQAPGYDDGQLATEIPSPYDHECVANKSHRNRPRRTYVLPNL